MSHDCPRCRGYFGRDGYGHERVLTRSSSRSHSTSQRRITDREMANELEELNGTLRYDNEWLRTEIAAVDARNRRLTSENSEMRGTIRELRAEIEALRTRSAERERFISHLQNTIYHSTENRDRAEFRGERGEERFRIHIETSTR